MSYSAEPPHSMIKELLCGLGEYVSQGGKIGREVGNLDFAIHGFSFFERFYFRITVGRYPVFFEDSGNLVK